VRAWMGMIRAGMIFIK